MVNAFLAGAVDAESTRRAYRRHLVRTFAFLNVDALAQLNGAQLASYRAAVLGAPLAPASQAQALDGSCQAPPVRADVLEQDLVDWLAKCRLDDQLEAATRAIVERGLRQRRIPTPELEERRQVKAVEGRLERELNLYR